jgi:hypothetical protein
MRLVLLFLFGFAAQAAAAVPFTFERLEEASARIQTVRVAFTQEKKLALFDEPVVSTGIVEISRPQAAVRWEFTGRSLIILKHGRLRRWSAEGKQEHGDDPGIQSMADQMRALLTGDLTGMQDLFTVTADRSGKPIILLVPREPGLARYVQRLDLRFRDDLSAPQSLLIVAHGGDETLYTFKEPEIGVELLKSRFEGP